MRSFKAAEVRENVSEGAIFYLRSRTQNNRNGDIICYDHTEIVSLDKYRYKNK